MSFTKTKLAKAVAIAITGSTLSVAAISDASAASTTMYNLFHENGGVACAPCSAGETDGWVWGGVADSKPTGTDTIATVTPNATNSAPGAGWAGTSAANKTPFGYIGGGVLHWAVELTGGQGGTAEISNADSIARYGKSADIDVAKGAWSDNISTNVGVAGGWRHDLDFGLFKSDKTGLTTLTATRVNGSGETNNIGFTVFKGMDVSTGSYGHHGAWNSTTNAGGLTNTSLPGGSTNFSGLPNSATTAAKNAAAIANIVAYSIGDPNVSLTTGTNLNTISFNAVAGQIYTIALGGYRNGDWTTTTDGYKLSVSQVPVPGAVWLFGSAMAGLIGFGRRKNKIAA